MANTAILIARHPITNEFGVPTGLENDDTLVGNGTSSWLWTVHNINASLTDAQVQALLDANVATYLNEIAVNNEVPLTAEQVAQYQDYIDIKKASDKVVEINADIELIQTAAPDPNTTNGYKAAFTAAAFGALTANQQTVLIRNTVSAMLTMLLHLQRSARLLLNIAKRNAAE